MHCGWLEVSHGLSPGGAASFENTRQPHAYTHISEKKSPLTHKAAWHTHPSSVYTAQCRIYACGLHTPVSNQTSQFCFGHHYTYRCCSSHYTADMNSHLGFCAKTSFTQKAKACIICQAKWQSFSMFITNTPGVYNRRKNRNRCNSHRKRDMTMPSGSH